MLGRSWQRDSSIYNQSIDKLIDIELNYNEYWEYILNTIKDIDNEKNKTSQKYK